MQTIANLLKHQTTSTNHNYVQHQNQTKQLHESEPGPRKPQPTVEGIKVCKELALPGPSPNFQQETSMMRCFSPGVGLLELLPAPSRLELLPLPEIPSPDAFTSRNSVPSSRRSVHRILPVIAFVPSATKHIEVRGKLKVI